MNSNRYIITRSCLEDGSMRLLKYNEGLFPEAGPGIFIDEQGREFPVQINRQRMLVTGLHGLYHDHNLGVNDVMLFQPLGAGRYQVELIVKPHALNPAGQVANVPLVPAERIVVSSTPHVREVRVRHEATGARGSGQPPLLPQYNQPQHNQPQHSQAEPLPRPAASHPAPATLQPLLPEQPAAQPQKLPQRPASKPASRPASIEEQVAEFARLTGYRLEHPASGLMRLHADLGPQYGYSVLLAADPLAMTQPVWEDALDEARLLLTFEAERPEGLARLTREALVSLIDHARLAPLSPVDLRGYWRSGDIDLSSAAAITELLSAHLAQRGSFTAVLLALAGQPAYSMVSMAEVAQRLGSGVNTAELASSLETLSRPPFMALAPLPGGNFLLRGSVDSLLGELGEYAQSVRRRAAGGPGAGQRAIPAEHVQAEQVLA